MTSSATKATEHSQDGRLDVEYQPNPALIYNNRNALTPQEPRGSNSAT